MSNIRVHELAKQLGKDSKDILKVLAEHGIEAKTHMSSITEETAVLVKKELDPNAGGSGNNKQEPVKSKGKPESGQKPARTAEAKEPEKKSHITQVYNPQNSGNNNKPKQNKKNNNNNNNHKNGDRKNNNTNHAPKQNENKNNPRRDMKSENIKNTDNKNNTRNDGQSGNNKNNDRNNNNRNNDRNNNNVRNNDNRGNRPNQRGNNNHNNNGQKNNNNRNNVNKPQPVQEAREEIKEITIPEYLTIKELADKMKIQPSVIVKKLFMQGQIVTINQEVDFETAQDIALQFEVIAEQEEKLEHLDRLIQDVKKHKIMSKLIFHGER